MPKFLIEWNHKAFPKKLTSAHPTRIERYLKNPTHFKGAVLLDCEAKEIEREIEVLQNFGTDSYTYNYEQPIDVINEKDETECWVSLEPTRWRAYTHEFRF